jgi:IS5 family transposase
MTPRARSSTRLGGRADAGAASFRRQASLQQHLAEAAELVRDIKQRAATAECVNALPSNRELERMPVRGLSKVRAVAYLYALAHNLMRMARISPQLLGLGTSAPAVAAAAT